MQQKLFIEHRKNMLNLMEDNSILIEFNRPIINDGAIFNYKYDENRNYFYLTGLFEYENIVILQKINGIESSLILINQYDELKAKWVGAPLSKEEVSKISGINNVRYLDSYNSLINQYSKIIKNIYLDFIPNNSNKLNDEEILAKELKNHYPWLNILNSRPLFTKLRTIKNEEEINQIRKAISITNEGIKNILAHINPLYEYQLESYFDQAIKYNGATGYAFPTIAASGANACCLHYMDNNSKASNGDLILFDLGASYNMYCSDISRTFPINGKFSKRQKEIYNIVLKGQEHVFNFIKPGITTKELNQILIEYYQVELKKIGLIKEGTKEEVLKYYYHGVSHHIGLDCHDLCEYIPLKAGCIISNEPGLYIEEENIGIRIEDDVLVTETGAEWLSKDILKTVEDIENFIKENKK